MKRTLLFAFSLLMVVGVYAQNSRVKIISMKTGQVLNGTTHTINGDNATFEVKEQFYAVMESGPESPVGVKRYEKQIISGSKEFLCWEVCYLPVAAGTNKTYIALDSVTMTANDTVDNFIVYIHPDENPGTACYRYVFQPGSDPADSSWVDICFEIESVPWVGIDENSSNGEIKIYPNPVKDMLSIENTTSDNNLTYELIDYQGRTILNGRLETMTTTVQLNTLSLDEGFYILQIRGANGVVKSERLLLE